MTAARQLGYPINAGAVAPETESARRWAVQLENDLEAMTVKYRELFRRNAVALVYIADMPCHCTPTAPWCGVNAPAFYECPKHVLERLCSGDE